MKKIIILLLGIFVISGCTLFEDMNEIPVAYTTLYPFEYATNYMFSSIGEVNSIYPSGADINSYKLTDKQKDIYSKADIFVYSSLDDEVKLAVNFINNNSNLNIMDATKGLNYNKSIEELWLNPSNYLMVVRNIKNSLNEYEDNVYNQEKIDKLYEELKIKISELDVEFTTMAKNANNNNILVADDSLMFLTKYNINALSLDQNNENYSKYFNEAKKSINNNEIKKIFIIKGKKLTDETETFIAQYKLEKVEIEPMYILSEEQRKEGKDYFSIMNENIDKFKTELYI